MSSKFATISLFRMSSRLSLFKHKQGNSNPFRIPSFLGFHTSNRYYVFEDIKNVDDALKLFDKMLQMKPIRPIYDFTKLLNILVKMEQYSQVVFMYKKMSLLGFPVNDYTMNIVIKCYCNLNQVKLGFAIVAAFLKRGYAPDVVTISCLIKGIFQEAEIVEGVCGNRMVDDAITLSSKMIQNGIFLDLGARDTLIDGLCKFKRWDEADKLLRQMVDSEIYPSIVTLNTLVNAYCEEGLIENAETVVQIMIERGMPPNVVTYNALMNGYSSRGRPDKAKELLNLMEKKMMKPDLVSYNTMINGYCLQGQLDKVNEVLPNVPTIRICYAPRYALLVGNRVGAVELLIEIQKRIQSFGNFIESTLVAMPRTVEFLGVVIDQEVTKTPKQLLRELESRIRAKHRIRQNQAHLRSAIQHRIRQNQAHLRSAIPYTERKHLRGSI